MRRLICFALAAVLLLTACGTSTSGGDGAETTTTVDTALPTNDITADGQSTTANTGDTTQGTQSTGGTNASASGTTTKQPNQSSGNTTNATTTTTTTTVGGGSTMSKYDNDYFRLGDGLANSYLKLQNEKKLTVAFMGGSVTYGTLCDEPETNAFRSLVISWLKQQFPKAEITQVNASYPSACSAYGAFTVDDKVIAKGADLVFIEYAINDSYAKSYYNLSRSKANYETIVRKLRQADATCDAVALYVTNKNNSYTDYMNGQEDVAKHYGIPSINVGSYLRDKTGMTTAQNTTAFNNLWSRYFADSAHANATGQGKYAEVIIDSLEKAFTAAKESGAKNVVKKTMPAAKNSGLMMNTDCVEADEIPTATGWLLTGSPKVFKNLVPNAEYTYSFIGTGITLRLEGAAGTSFEYAVDGGAMQTVTVASGNTYHLPLPVVEGLKSGNHTITFKVKSAGTLKIRTIFVTK